MPLYRVYAYMNIIIRIVYYNNIYLTNYVFKYFIVYFVYIFCNPC